VWNLTLTLREKHKLRVFVNRVLRRILELKSDEIILGWRKLRNEELDDLYSLPSIIRMIKSRRMQWAGLVARMGKKTKSCRILVREVERKRPLGRCRWEDNIKIDIRETGWGGMDWICLAQDRDQWQAPMNMVMNFLVS
jgi:hypothetical protein